MKFYKIKALFILTVTRFLSWVLKVEMPPILSVSALIKNGDKLLFIKHSYINGYGIPGGIVKGGETIQEALDREVREETGLIVVRSEYIKSYPSRSYGVATISLAYIVETKGKLKSSEEGIPEWHKPMELLGQFAYKDTELTIKDYLKK